MLFLNSILLAGLAGVLIPIILHLIRRQAAKPLDWGAMRFLFDTVAMRKRRMEWEDMLLMATRCLLLALIALAIARPFVPPNSSVPWVVVLPLSLLGVAAIAGSVVLSDRKPRWLVRLIGVVCILLAIAAVVWERRLNLKRFRLEGGRDVALVIDASTSMTLPQGNQTSFEAAIEEAREIVKNSPRGTAFSVILGGPAPELKTATPLTHRADVLEVLDQLRPVGGPFRAQDALGVATLSLAQGENTGKEILVLSDSQRIGWRTDSPSAWSSLADAMDSLPRKPRLMVRSFPPPEDLRNVAISSIDMSREVIGTDRPATLYVTVENTGNAAITPGKIQLTVNGSEVSADEHVGQLVPGQQETVEFRHRFKTVGAQVVMAHIDVKDDLPEDDRFERIVIARKRLPVILVDGNPSGSFFERAAGFTALALAPAADLVRDGKTKSDYLMEPVVITAPEVANLKEIAPNSVIVLADVPRLPASVAQQIEQFVANGGGLLVLSGQRADESFYNAWQGGDGQVLPLQLGKTQTEKDGISPAEETFDHAALKLFSNEKQSDIGRAMVYVYRSSEQEDSSRYVVARYANGEPFLTAKNYGQGRVMMATTGFDSRSGNLPGKESFVPFVHEIITWLAGASGVNLNMEASWSPTLILPGGGGLQGEYFRGNKTSHTPAFTRIDPTINFNWKSGSPDSRIPKDRFAVRWTGRLLPAASGEYTFQAEVDDQLELEINGKRILWAKQGSSTVGKVTLEAGKMVNITVNYEESWGESFAKLFWTPPGGSRSILPSSVLFPPVNEDSGAELLLDTTEVIDPLGMKRIGRLEAGRRGMKFTVEGTAAPGVYQMTVPSRAADALLAKPGSKIPMVVTRDVAESRLTPLNDDDRALIEKHLDVVDVRNRDDVLAVLSGKGFGEELWKLLAVAAFSLLLLEVALARWISKSRRAGEEVKIDFKNDDDSDQRFMAEFNRVKGEAS